MANDDCSFDGSKAGLDSRPSARVVAASLAALFGAKWIRTRRTKAYETPVTQPPPYLLPDGFLWGAGTSDHQIEHAQPDDWTDFERRTMALTGQPQQGRNKKCPAIHNFHYYPEDVRIRKTNFDEFFEQDIEMIARMKHNAYRFSISWSRLFPREGMKTPDPQGLAYYRRIIEALKRRGIVAFVTLMHFATPAWLWRKENGKTGFGREDFLPCFEQYVRAVAEHYGGDVTHWCTLNEPVLHILGGYLDGSMPPHHVSQNLASLNQPIATMLEAHAAAYRILKEDARRRGKEAVVGLTQHVRVFEPYRNWSIYDRVLAMTFEKSLVWDFLDAIKTGTFRLAATGFTVDIPGLKGSMDYVGMNYYSKSYVKADCLRPWKFEVLLRDPDALDEIVSDVGWCLYPRGLGITLKKAHERYGLPVYVLENGIADAEEIDRTRQEFIIRHVMEIWHAIQHGVDVRGYFYWSLLDNFEWGEGFKPRFGLARVEYLNGFRRTPRPSAKVYTNIIEANGVTSELAEKFGVWKALQ